MDVSHYTQDGAASGTTQLPDAVFGARRNDDLLHQVVTAMAANQRQNTAHAKDRSEVSGGGKKPWRQKGTGNARHGSIRSPLWRGGGATFGPRNERSYVKHIPRQMRNRALTVALSQKVRAGRLVTADMPSLEAPKTATMKAFLAALGEAAGLRDVPSRPRRSVLLITPGYSPVLGKSIRNIGSVSIAEARDVSARDLTQYRYTILLNPEECVAVFQQRLNTGTQAQAA